MKKGKFLTYDMTHPGNFDIKKVNGKLYKVRRQFSPVKRKLIARKYWSLPIWKEDDSAAPQH